jgi:hypothetical protein
MECLSLPKRLARRMTGRLGNLHGLSRRSIGASRGIGRRSLARLEEFLAYLLGSGFRVVSEEDYHEPGLPGIVGRPLIEVLSDGPKGTIQ